MEKNDAVFEKSKRSGSRPVDINMYLLIYELWYTALFPFSHFKGWAWEENDGLIWSAVAAGLAAGVWRGFCPAQLTHA